MGQGSETDVTMAAEAATAVATAATTAPLACLHVARVFLERFLVPMCLFLVGLGRFGALSVRGQH